MNCAPVLMMGFNRPELSRMVFERVRKARPEKLYFAVDGFRRDKPEEEAIVKEVQSIVGSVDWPCEVHTRFRDVNLGCAYAIPDAISWMLSSEAYGIILEDDVCPGDGFFAYETELLERYKDDTRIGMVSGFNQCNYQTSKTDSYHFSNRADIWGWGTWSRVWKDYSLDVSSYLPKIDEMLEGYTSNGRMKKSIRGSVEWVCRELTTWDIQFMVMFIAHGYLSAVPRRRMTGNFGFGDVRAVHTTAVSYDSIYYNDIWDGESIVHPQFVHPDVRAIDLTERRMCGKMAGALMWLADIMPRFRSRIFNAGKVLECIAPALFRI